MNIHIFNIKTWTLNLYPTSYNRIAWNMSELLAHDPNNILEIKTVQIAPFRTLMTALKDILVETNIEFTREGMTITNLDKSKTILAHINLQAENFEQYVIHVPRIVVGVNIYQLFKLINGLDNDDTLTIYISRDHYTDGAVSHMGLKFENGDIKQTRNLLLRLIEPELETLELPDVTYSSVINLPSADFQKIIRDMTALADKLEIKCVGDELIFSLDGPYANVQIKRTECDSVSGSAGGSAGGDLDIIQGLFSLKYLNYCIKCTNLCSSIELMLGNDMPLIVRYNVASLGEFKLCLSQLPYE
jgi:proliferating cell nuclear antigen